MTAHPQTINGRPIPAVPPTQHKWWHFVERRLPIIVIYLMVITLVGAILAPHVVVTVPSGHVGLMWKRFRGGTVLDPRQLKDEGLRVLLPWDKMFLYDLRLQTTTDTYNAITKDGVSINATISIRFRLKHDAVPQLHQAIGPDYIARLVRPEIGSRMREVIADYTAEEVYSTKRQDVQRGIRGHTQKMLSEKTMERTAEQSEYGDAYRVPMDELLNLLDTLVLGIVLPPTVVNAINRKVEQYYLSEEYVFRVAREKKESERKKIEAEGISEFQRIVSQGISDSYLRWRGIEATLQLAQSPNSKIVVIGNSKDGMPIILGNVDFAASRVVAVTRSGETNRAIDLGCADDFARATAFDAPDTAGRTVHVGRAGQARREASRNTAGHSARHDAADIAASHHRHGRAVVAHSAQPV